MEIVKKAIAVIAIILLILTSSITIAVSDQKGTVATDTLRLRKEASLESTVLELLYKDDEVEILEEEGEWYKVNYKTYTGYVSKEFIQKGSNKSTNTNEENNQTNNNESSNNQTNNNETNNNQANNQAINNTNKKATVNTDLDVYILPLINSSTIGKLKANTQLELISITGVWTYVKSEDLAGWIKLDKITVADENNQVQNKESEDKNEEDKKEEENKEEENKEEENKEENKETETTTNENDKPDQENPKTEEPENKTDDKTDDKSEETNETKKTETTMYPESKTYYVNSSAVNVRAKSNTDSNVVTTVALNTEIKVVGEEADWYKVEVNGTSGYMSKSLLSTEKTEVTTRSTTQDRTTTEKSDKKEESAVNSAESSSKGEEIVAYAKKFLGCRYVYGGSGPNTFDCSGFTMYVYKHFGYSLAHTATVQATVGKYVAKSNLQPGDLIIFNDSDNVSIGHVGMYVGGGNFIHASSGSGKIIISSLSGAYYKARYVTARRLI